MKHTDMFSTGSSTTKNLTLIDRYFELFLQLSEELNGDVYLKGNVLLNKLFPHVARSTLDMDMAIPYKMLYEDIQSILYKFCSQQVNDGNFDSFEIAEEISPTHSGGLKAYKDGRVVFAIDVSLDINIYSRHIKYCLQGREFNGSSINAILCDKILATLSHKRFRRAKDFFDLYVLRQNNVEFDSKTVLDFMIQKVGIEEVHELISNYPFSDEILLQMIKAWDKLKITSSLLDNPISKPEFMEVYGIASYYYSQIESELSKRS